MQTWLLAEDNQDDAFLFKIALEKVGAEVTLTFAEDGEQAINYLSGQGKFADRTQYPFPHYLFLDLKMPKVDGLDVLRWKQAQENRNIKRLPVVMLTSSRLGADIEKAYDLGANSYVVKPNSIDGLTELVQALKTYWLELNCSPRSDSESK